MHRLSFGCRGAAGWLVPLLLGGTVGVLSCHPPPMPPQLSIEEQCEYRIPGGKDDLAAYERCLLVEADKDSSSTDAGRVFRKLLGTRFKAEASRGLGAQMRNDDPEEAKRYANASIEAAEAANDRICVARGLTLRSQALCEDGRFVEAFRDAEKAETELRNLPHQSHTAHEPAMSKVELANAHVSALITKGDALRRAGVTKQACVPLREATDIKEADACLRAWAKVKLAMCQEESGNNDEAKKWLREARAEGCTEKPRVVTQIALNEALQHLLDGDPELAEKKFAESVKADGDDSDTSLLRAYAAVARDQLEDAKLYLEKVLLDPSDADWPWVIQLDKADIARRQDDLALAESTYKLSIAEVNKLRNDSRSRSAYLMTSHQAPYEGLISLLASQSRWDEVLAVVHSFDASDMLRAAANPSLPMLGEPGIAVPMQTATLLEAWRGKDVVILFVPSERMIWKDDHAYRFRIRNGKLTGEELGSAEELRDLIFRLQAAPDDPDRAREVGRRLLPQDDSTEPLHVLSLGEASRVPLSLLRRADDSLAQATRPMSSLPALQTNTPPVSFVDGPVVVVGSPRGDLPDAARERDDIAGEMRARAPGREVRVLGAGALLKATPEEFFKERRPSIFHVAAHVRTREIWLGFELADETFVDAPELLRSGLAPALAVLANCGSAAEEIDERWGSVAISFIEAGTLFVIATRHTIPDRQAATLMKALYQQPEWPADPVRSLAKVQVLAGTEALTDPDGKPIPANVWSAFLVIERPVYLPRAGASR